MKITRLRPCCFGVIVCMMHAMGSVAAQTDSRVMTLPVVVDESNVRVELEASIEIDKVWAGHRVGFALLTEPPMQYVAYYNAERRMVVGQRWLDASEFATTVLPSQLDRAPRTGRPESSTILGWDSHNSIMMTTDAAGYIHLAGNMHANKLTYFRSEVPRDISTLRQVESMVGRNEARCTYPKFMPYGDGKLLFQYRDGGSGNGNEIFNIYDPVTRQWSRFLDTPLTDGEGKMNAYQSQPERGPDGSYHVTMVWRDTPDAATNHDLCYIKSPDLKTWYNAGGDKLDLPVRVGSPGVIVDPVPVHGGIINGCPRFILDAEGRPVIAYMKYDAEGNSQLYAARFMERQWKINQLTDWKYRWDFGGGGSLPSEGSVGTGTFSRRDDGRYELGYRNGKYGNGTFLLDEDLTIVGQVRKARSLPGKVLGLQGKFPGLERRSAGDSGTSGEPDVSFSLRWESLGSGRDLPREKPWPEPSTLYLYKIRTLADQVPMASSTPRR